MAAPSRRPGPGLAVGRVAGIPIFLGPSWFVVALVVTVVYQPSVAGALPGIGSAAWLVSLVFALLLYASVLLHELGHSLVALRMGMTVRSITLHAFVGLSEIEHDDRGPGREAAVAAAGPAVSALLAAAAGLAVLSLPRYSIGWVLAIALMWSNLLIAVLNALPGLPLDGGRVLRAGAWRLLGDQRRATVVAAWTGRVVALVIVAAGLAWILAGSGGDGGGLWNAVMIAVVASFIWAGATASLQSAGGHPVVPDLRARDLARRALPVSRDLPLAEALRRLAVEAGGALVVVDPTGRPTGIVSESAVSRVPAERRPWIEVGTLARGMTDGLRLPAGLAGGDLLAALRSEPAEEYLLVEPDGSVYGVLAARDVAGTMATAGRR